MLFKPTKTNFDALLRDLASADGRVRAAAADQLGDVKDDDERARAAAALGAALGDERWEVRAQVALSLGDVGGPAEVDALLARLRDDRSEVRQSAVIALGRMKAAAAFDALVEALKDGPADVRFQAASSIAEIDPKRAYDPLIDAVRDGDPEVRANVAAALGELGDKRAAGWLAELLDDSNAETRFEAAFALARLSDARAVEPLLAFIGDERKVYDVIEGVEHVGDRRAAEPLAKLTKRFLAPRLLRVRAAAALVTIAPDHAAAPVARKLLEKATRDGREEVRGLATEALEKLHAAR